jgi:tetratricopeptide (TPR) repeat protein
MNYRIVILVGVSLVLGALLSVPAGAQVSLPDPEGGVLLPAEPAATKQPAAPADADAEMLSLLDGMSQEELEALVKVAAERRLRMERDVVAAEISQNILYEEDDIRDALAILNDDVQNTQADNIDRIARAYAKVDPLFAQPYKLYQQEQYAKAGETLRKRLNPQDATYLSAVMHYLCADSLAKAGQSWEAIDLYTNLMVNLPDRISFAAEASMDAAHAYEDMNRRMYAMEMYIYALKNYSLTMSREQVDELYERVEALQELYKDPMGAVSSMMAEVTDRLRDEDAGEQTQKTQGEIVALLEDLIQTAEEKQNSSQQQQQQQQQGKRKNEDNQQAKSQGQSKQGQQPSGNQPSSPALAGGLVPGPLSQPNRLAREHGSDESGKWAELPPREREQVQSVMKQRLAERRGDLVRDYHKKIAEGE